MAVDRLEFSRVPEKSTFNSLSIAFLSPAWPPGAAANGIVTYVDQIAGGFTRLGHNPCILSASGGPDFKGSSPPVYYLGQEPRTALSRLLDPLMFRLSPASALRRRYAANLLSAANRAIAERRVELLEMEETFGLLQLIRRGLRVPVVVRLHGPHFANAAAAGTASGSAYRRRVRREGSTVSLADGVSAPSADILARTREFYGLPLERAIVIPYPAPLVDPAQRWQLDSCDRSRILFVGRFDRHKGGDILIDCFARLARNFPSLRLWFAGPDSGFLDDSGRAWTLAEYLRHRAPEVASRVDFLGRRRNSDLSALRRQAFITIVASRYETLGFVVLEAMAHGCPTVATRTGGIPETLHDGVDGLLCKPCNPEHMAAQVARLLLDPDLAATLGSRAAEDALQRHHPDRIAAQTAQYYRSQLLDNKNFESGDPTR